MHVFDRLQKFNSEKKGSKMNTKTRKYMLFATLVAVFALASSSVFAQQVTLPPSSSSSSASAPKITLQATMSHYCVGQPPEYNVNAPINMAGEFLSWSYSFRPFGLDQTVTVPTISEGFYGRLQGRGSFSYWTGMGSTLKVSDAGTWTQTVSVGGSSDTVTFQVDFCDASALSASFYLADAEFFGNIATSAGTKDVYVVMNGLVDRSTLKAWRVVVNNQNRTKDLATVFNSTPVHFATMYEVSTPASNYAGGTVLVIPIPVGMLQQGNNQVEVEIRFQNGSKGFSSRNYPLRPVDETIRDFIFPVPPVPEETLVCQFSQQVYTAGQWASFNAAGGDGTFFWIAEEGQPSSGSGRNFGTTFAQPGVKRVTVYSNSRSAVCTLTVLAAPPQPPAPPKV